MRKLRTIFTLLLLFCMTLPVLAQQTAQSGIGETMRSNGRIYVVVAVIVTILVGLILYLVRLEKKIKKMEREI